MVSKKHRNGHGGHETAMAAETPTNNPAPRVVPKHRQCPQCYGGRGGVGVERWHSRKGAIMRTCYQCDTCGFDWIANIKTVSQALSIEWQEVEIEHGEIHLDTR
jgi:hypothetical protein